MPLYHTQEMTDSRANNFEIDVIKYLTSTYHSIPKKVYNIFKKFTISIFLEIFEIKKNKISKT